MLGEKCSHGVKCGDECRECQLVWDRELVSRWKPEIEAAEKRIAAAAGQSVMLTVGGKPFRCQCGCNVLHRLSGERDLYACNACEIQYEGE